MIPALLVFLVVSLGTGSLVLLGGWVREQRDRREVMRQMRMLAAGRPGEPEAAAQSLLREDEDVPWLEAARARFPKLAGIGELLVQSGLSWGLQRFVVLSAVGALVGGVGALVVEGGGMAVPVSAFCGGLLPYFRVRRARRKRLAAFEEQLPEGIDLIARAIRAGHPLSSGLKMVTEETSEPMAGEFRRVFEELKFGLPFEDSLHALVARVPLVDLRILVTAILIQRDVGGNLAEILDNLARMIRIRFTMRRQLRTYTAQGRMSGYIVAALPLAVGSTIFLLNPDYMMTLFRVSVGRYMVAGAALLQVLGLFWIRRIVDVDI